MRVFVLGALLATIAATGCGKKDDPQQAKADPMKGIIVGDPKPEPPPPPPPPPDPFQGKGNPAPKGLVQGVRAAAYRPERLNELRQIAIFFNQFHIERNKNPASDKEFIDYIKRDAGSIAKALEEKYYILNLKVNTRDAGAVVAYESLQDQGGYQAARVDASVAPIPEAELRKLLTP